MRLGAAAQSVGVRGGGDLAQPAGEQRLRRPGARERLDADRLYFGLGERRIGGAPGGALAVVGQARAGRDQHEPLHPVWDPQRERECEPPAHRVAGEREAWRRERLEAVELGLPRSSPREGQRPPVT